MCHVEPLMLLHLGMVLLLFTKMSFLVYNLVLPDFDILLALLILA